MYKMCDQIIRISLSSFRMALMNNRPRWLMREGYLTDANSTDKTFLHQIFDLVEVYFRILLNYNTILR